MHGRCLDEDWTIYLSYGIYGRLFLRRIAQDSFIITNTLNRFAIDSREVSYEGSPFFIFLYNGDIGGEETTWERVASVDERHETQ